MNVVYCYSVFVCVDAHPLQQEQYKHTCHMVMINWSNNTFSGNDHINDVFPNRQMDIKNGITMPMSLHSNNNKTNMYS